MTERDRRVDAAAPGVSASGAAVLRSALEAVVEVPPPLQLLQTETVGPAPLAGSSPAAGILKRDALQAGAAHRDRVRARLATLEATAPESDLAQAHQAAVAVLRDELPRLAALGMLVEAEASGDPDQIRRMTQSVRDAQTIAAGDRERLGAALRDLAAAQPALFASLALPERVRASFALAAPSSAAAGQPLA